MRDSFSEDQQKEIRLGTIQGIDVSVYKDVRYLAVQMHQIRLGLVDELEVKWYARPDFDWFQMEEIRLGLVAGIDVSKYADEYIPYLNMRQIRLGLLDGNDLSDYKYLSSGILKELRLARVNKIDLLPFITAVYKEEQLEQIRYSLIDQVDLTPYITPEYRGIAIREIRLGLEENLDVSLYANLEFDWRQMQEIRFALEMRLPIEPYINPLYSWSQLREIRLGLSDGIDISRYSSLMYTSKEMARIREKLLSNSNDFPEKGADGYYEYFYGNSLGYKPVLLDDGSIDYTNFVWFETVREGDIIALYHDATVGKSKVNDEGETIYGIKGKDLPILSGSGFRLEDDRRTYVAAIDGRIEITEGTIRILPVLVVDEVNANSGKIEFEGTIQVRGDVLAGSQIHAAKDVVIEGSVEGADITAGENIILKKGCNANDNGILTAGSDIRSKFLEHVTANAGGSIYTNASLNAELNAANNIICDGREATVMGGTIKAGAAITVGRLGNESAYPTTVIIEGKTRYKDIINKLKKEQEEIAEEIQMLEYTLNQMKMTMSIESRNSNDTYNKLEYSIYSKQEDFKEKDRKIKETEKESAMYSNSCITVYEDLYEGVQVILNGKKWDSRHLRNVEISEISNRISIRGR